MGSTEVTVMIRYRAQPEKADIARRELESLIRTVVATERECAGIWMHLSTSDPGQILLVERWSDEAAYTGPHMRTPHLQSFMSRAREFIAGPPEITFWRGVAGAER